MYRVGMQCFKSADDAHDYVLSSVVPAMTPDGKFTRPYKVGNSWFHNGEQVVLTFPECNPVDEFKDGALVGSSLLMVFIVIMSFRMIYRAIYLVGGENDT